MLDIALAWLSGQPCCNCRYAHQLSPALLLVWTNKDTKYIVNVCTNLHCNRYRKEKNLPLPFIRKLTSPTSPLRSSANANTASCQPWKEAEMPGCCGTPCTLVILSKRANTLECSLQLSTTSLSSREGWGGSLGAPLPTLGNAGDPGSFERPG